MYAIFKGHQSRVPQVWLSNIYSPCRKAQLWTNDFNRLSKRIPMLHINLIYLIFNAFPLMVSLRLPRRGCVRRIGIRLHWWFFRIFLFGQLAVCLRIRTSEWPSFKNAYEGEEKIKEKKCGPESIERTTCGGPGNSDSLAKSQPFRALSKVQNCSHHVTEHHITQLGRFDVP
jgi:hypothetical protein